MDTIILFVGFIVVAIIGLWAVDGCYKLNEEEGKKKEGKDMSKKIYKGYQLIKAIADGEIKEGSRFIDNYTEYIYEKDKLCNEELTLYRKDVFTGAWESPDYSLFVEKDNEFELIEEDAIDIESIEEINMITERDDGLLKNIVDNQNKLLRWAKQHDKEIKELKEK